MRDIKLAELNNIGGGCPFMDAFGLNNPMVVVIMPNGGHPGGMGFVPPMPPYMPPMPPMMCPPPPMPMCPPPCGPECFPPAP